MAVNKVPSDSILKLEVQKGVDGGGMPVYSNISFYGVKATAALQDLYDTAAALAGLQQFTLNSVSLVERGRLESV